MTPSTEPHLEPLSVPAPKIGAWLTASPYSNGIRFTSVMQGHDLRLDIIDFPERAPEVGSIRALMQLGRVVNADFEQLILVDGQEALFVVAGPVTYLCRSRCSFRLLGVRRPRGFSLPMLNADGAGYRSR